MARQIFGEYSVKFKANKKGKSWLEILDQISIYLLLLKKGEIKARCWLLDKLQHELLYSNLGVYDEKKNTQAEKNILQLK